MKIYRLLKPHKHRRIELPAGAQVPFDDVTARFLAEHGVISDGSIIHPAKLPAAPPASTIEKVKPKHAVRASGCVGCGWRK